MRWDDLFDDLEGQLERELHAEVTDLRLHEERQRLEKLSLRTRLSNVVRSAGLGGTVRLRVVLASGETLSLRPTTLGRDWLAAELLDARNSRVQCVIPLSAIAGVLLTEEQSLASLAVESAANGKLIERVGFPFVLRDLCRRRRTVQLDTRGGVLAGTIDRVARDHLDLAVHPLGTLRRSPEVLHYRLVPFWQIYVIRLR
ncbi:MAG: hypothetical protein LH475_10005 [Cryobacterium sp.]|uniref:hypothetical protein n=1 Tax=unclassified Cryobacterium TaxID=2649013 RepID=UPI0018C8EED3|nr:MULTISPECIES: hypothetical protein [unclassified Cryobacterium]MCY7404939.1 hypothetical protein [Cryobacterium sp.]